VTTNWAGEANASQRSDRSLPQGILLGLGAVMVIIAGFAASAVPPQHEVIRYGVLVVVVFVFTALTGVWAAPVGVAVVGFMLFDGFLVNQLGELTWHGGADLSRLFALTAAVIFGRLAGDTWRLYRLFARAHAERRAVPGPRMSFTDREEELHDA
jgi:hypothetical protein